MEIHVVHGCNLTCESCSHYSDQGHKGTLSLDEADHWMKLWNKRVNPKKFSLVGGEPTIHPKLAEFVLLSRRNWPDAMLRLVTNGFFLHRHPDLPLVLKNDPNARLYLSIHHDGPEFREKHRSVLDLVRNWEIKYGIRVTYNEVYTNWSRRYKGFGSGMEPYEDEQPRQSWENCRAKYCYQLFEGKIWKCAPLAYLKLQHAKYQLSDKWQPYLRYQPLQPECTDKQLETFFDLEEESFCNMCPAYPERFVLPDPLARNRVVVS